MCVPYSMHSGQPSEVFIDVTRATVAQQPAELT